MKKHMAKPCENLSNTTKTNEKHMLKPCKTHSKTTKNINKHATLMQKSLNN